MKSRFVVSCLLFLAALAAVARTAVTPNIWYVDGVRGDDNNNCESPQTPCRTIKHAISLASPSDKILVGPGTYNENLTIKFSLGIIGSGASTTIIDGQGRNTVVSIPYSNRRVLLSGFTLRNGEGGVYNNGNARIYDSIVTGNSASGYYGFDAEGSGIDNYGTLTLDRCTVSNNETYGSYFGYGGGIANWRTMIINDGAITGNSSSTTDVYGAGIYNAGTLMMKGSTVSGNSSGGGYLGGAIYNDVSATATVNNSTVYGNTSYSIIASGGIRNSGTLSINSSTVDGNANGGISNGATVILENSIIADNDGNCYGTMISNGFNLSSDDTCNFNGPSDLNNTEPKLGPLQNNGGLTQTMAEGLDSPTVDAGNPHGCTDGQGHLLTTDQRGAPRPGKFKGDHRCDMGAFERQAD
jgi:hypothetical protein